MQSASHLSVDMLCARDMMQQLHSRYSQEEARSIVLYLFEKSFGVRPVDIYADKVRHFSAQECDDLQKMFQRLLSDEPVQYVVGVAEFDGMDYKVSPATLIPRPETEDLVRHVATLSAFSPTPCILDAGTGTGCIAIALKHRLPGAHLYGWDISEDALAVARENAISHGVSVCFQREDILSPNMEPSSQWDVIVSNPPYVCRHESAEMMAHVKDYEPACALFVPDENPLLFYRALAELALRNLKEGGSLCVEINSALGAETAQLFEAKGLRKVQRIKDRFGKERIISCEK